MGSEMCIRDRLYGARGQRVVDWQTRETVAVEPVRKTGASFHYVDTGIDSGEVIFDVLGTDIDPEDHPRAALEQLQPQPLSRAHQGLALMAETVDA